MAETASLSLDGEAKHKKHDAFTDLPGLMQISDFKMGLKVQHIYTTLLPLYSLSSE